MAKIIALTHTGPMKRITLPVVACCMIAFAPTAHADQWSYVSYLDQNGVYYDSVLDVIDTGKATCHHLRNGMGVGAVMQAMGSRLGYAIKEQAIIVQGATLEMCPDQRPKVLAFANGTGP